MYTNLIQCVRVFGHNNPVGMYTEGNKVCARWFCEVAFQSYSVKFSLDWYAKSFCSCNLFIRLLHSCYNYIYYSSLIYAT